MMTTTEDTIRPSQLIYHAGPGAILDLLEETVMVLAADLWNTYGAVKELDPRITKYLNVDHVRILNEQTDKIKVKTVPFPLWKICPKCGKMTTKHDKTCWVCAKDGKGEVKLYPSRFVTVCNYGHISDFPYDKWVHKGENCKKPNMRLMRGHQSGSLSDLSVLCTNCRETRSLGQIMKPNEEDKHIFECTNESPWLEKRGDTVVDEAHRCKNTMRTFLRGASNIYSPHVLSFLKVPLTVTDGENQFAYIDPTDLEYLRELYSEVSSKERFILREAKKLGIKEAQYMEFEKILQGTEVFEEPSFESIRKQEWNTLIEPYFDEADIQFKSEKVMIHPKLQPYFSTIHRVDLVPEIQVLKGFSRIDYIDRFEEGDVHINDVIQNSKQNWLPAVRNYGEGIFFVFDPRKLELWEQNDTITSPIIERYNATREEFGNEPIPLMGRHILMHTFSHALLKELAAHSGYGTTALKERLYIDQTMHGVFIYTASGDSEGSLGGLTALSQPDVLYPIVLRAIEKMEHCSSDPNCSDGKFQFNLSANAAACHSCSHVSETSCEWGNQLLDRRTLLNINPNEKFGYFDDLLNNE